MKPIIKTFSQYINELNHAGEDAGSMEVDRITVQQALVYAQHELGPIYVEIPKLADNFKLLQSLTSKGHTQRKDMPVIKSDDLRDFQSRLASGRIDIIAPFAADTKPSDPFPQGLSGQQAQQWLSDGLRDGNPNDDRVKVSIKTIAAKNLIPIQQQIYFDKCIDTIVNHGMEGTLKYLQDKSILIASSDNRIIDGHHRWATAVLVNPSMNVHILAIDLPISKLLPLAIAYGDAIGNQRNA